MEGWVWTRRAFLLPGGAQSGAELAELWPQPADECFWRRLVQAHETLVQPIFRAMLEYVGADPGPLLPLVERPPFALRLNHYPVVADGAEVASAVAAGAGRMVGHEDVDLFTLLPAPSSPGLQVLNRQNGKWVRVTPPADSILLNTGDYSQLLFNDRFPSTTHRVAAPPVDDHAQCHTKKTKDEPYTANVKPHERCMVNDDV